MTSFNWIDQSRVPVRTNSYSPLLQYTRIVWHSWWMIDQSRPSCCNRPASPAFNRCLCKDTDMNNAFSRGWTLEESECAGVNSRFSQFHAYVHHMIYILVMNEWMKIKAIALISEGTDWSIDSDDHPEPDSESLRTRSWPGSTRRLLL